MGIIIARRITIVENNKDSESNKSNSSNNKNNKSFSNDNSDRSYDSSYIALMQAF